MELSQAEINEMSRVKAYFPYRVVLGVKLPDGKFEVFANATKAKANNFARKNNGVVFEFTK